MKNRNEVFTYDALDRLLTAQLAGSATYNQTMIYHPNGNINVKSDIGTYLYESPKPNAMSGFNGVYAGVTSDRQFIDYTTFNKVSEIRQGVDENTITKRYDIYYGLDEQRIKSVLSLPQGGGLVGATTRYYFGAYEKDIDRFGNTTQTDYIYTPAGLTAMMKGGTLYYIHTDNLGSIQTITDESKNTVSSYYYTPWGARVLLSGVNITDRGYTFHEHLEPFCLINMNGRVYDPMLARFLSPDPYVQAPDYTQGFNRYSYCYNNPFKYTDPSGELQLGPFYASLNLGWGYGGGFYFGISAGVGLEGGAYAGISIGYNTSGSFSFSASAGIAGFYVSGGYDTKGGWNASAGWSAPLPSFGIVSFNTNMLGVSGSYSQNGGWSYNHMGVQINKSGMSFSPSVGVSTVLYGVEYSAVNIALGYEETGEQFKNNEELHAQINAEIGDVETIQNDLNTTIVLATHYGVNGLFGSKGYYLKSNDGMLYGQGGRVGGTTKHVWGLITGNHSKIFISPGVKGISENGKNVLQSTVVHEMIHAYHINMFHNGKMTGKQYTQYSEAVAYSYSLAYYKLHGMPYFTMKAGEQLNSMNVRAYPKSIDYTPLSKYKIW